MTNRQHRIGPTPGGVPLHGMAPQARVMEYKVCGPATPALAISNWQSRRGSPYTLVGSSSGTVTNTFMPKPVAERESIFRWVTRAVTRRFDFVMANNAALAGTIVVAAAGNSGPGPGTMARPGAATLAISPAASLDPGSLSAGDLLAGNQVTNDNRQPLSAGPMPETGAESDANLPQPGGRQNMSLFPAAGAANSQGLALSVLRVRGPARRILMPQRFRRKSKTGSHWSRNWHLRADCQLDCAT